MLSYVWGGIIILSVVVGLATGRGEALSSAIFTGASSAVSLLITIIGISAFWCGMMEIAEKSGIINSFATLCRPVVHLLFKNVRKNSSAEKAICANIAANIIGVSNAATPLGLRAMGELAKDSPKGEASHDMSMLVLINAASVQIVPSTVVALRVLYGSSAPYKIMPWVWITSFTALFVGVVLFKFFEKITKRP